MGAIQTKGETATARKSGEHQALRHLSHALVEVSNHKLHEIVALVDAMDRRGEADRLIAPLRNRLALIRPPRPLRFSRLLFLPLDPVIVAAPLWRPGRHRLPRNAIMPLAEMVRRALGSEAAAIEAAIAGRNTADLDVIATAGRQLWPLAAAVLRQTAEALTPDGSTTAELPDAAIRGTWSAAGMAENTLPALATAAAAALSEAPMLAVMERDAARGLPVDPASLDGMLERAAHQHPLCFSAKCWGLLMALLLARMPAAAPLLRLAAGSPTRPTPAALRAAASEAVDEALDELEQGADTLRGITEADLATTGTEAQRIAALLDSLDGDGAPPARLRRVEAIRRRMDQSCRARFIEALTREILPRMAQAGARNAAEWQALEAEARDLRRLESIGRRFGGGEAYDALLGEAAAMAAAVDQTPPTLASRVRLVELLAGPEAAMAVLETASRPILADLAI